MATNNQPPSYFLSFGRRGDGLLSVVCMKLLVVTQKVDAADANLGFFVRWIEKLSERAEITVIANEVRPDAQRYVPSSQIHLHSLGKEGGVSRFSRLLQYRQLLRAELPHADGVFFHMCPEYVLAAGLLPKKYAKRTLLWYMHKEVSLRLRVASWLVDKIFTASKESCRIRSKKVETVGHGIDVEFFPPMTAPIANPSALRLFTAGRISRAKDLRTLIFGFFELERKLPTVALQLALFGKPITEADKQYKAELEALTAPSPEIFWGHAYHTSLREFYTGVESGRTVFVHASRTGSMDKAVLEALAAGLPVFTSSEAFSENIPGVVKFREGDPLDLARKVVSSFESDKMGYNSQSRNYVKQKHSLEGLIQRIVAFYA